MKRAIRSIMLVLVIIALVGCAPKPAAEPTAAAQNPQPTAVPTKPLKVGLLSPGPVHDQGWNETAYNGIQLIKEQLGAEVSYVEVGESPAEFEKAFTDYASQGFDLVIGHGYQFQDAALKVAAQFPKTIFITSGGSNVAPNLAPVVMSFEEANYLIGIIGGNMSKSHVGAAVGGVDIPAISGPIAGFEAGFKTVPGSTFSVTYLGSWTDVGAAKEAALAANSAGADVIFANANIAGQGVFQAAQEKNFWSFGISTDQSSLAPKQILASAIMDYAQAFLQVAKTVQGGKFVGNKPIYFGLKDEGMIVDIVYNPALESTIPADVKAKVEQARQDIISGKIKVPGGY